MRRKLVYSLQFSVSVPHDLLWRHTGGGTRYRFNLSGMIRMLLLIK